MICFDTMVLIWAVQGNASSGQEAMVDRARRYLHHLQEEKATIMVPTPVLAEYLQGFDQDARRQQLEVLARHFLLSAFDVPAAYLAAALARKAPRAEGVPRQSVKTDIQIIATTARPGASQIITHERSHFERLANRTIRIRAIPLIEEQGSLFDD